MSEVRRVTCRTADAIDLPGTVWLPDASGRTSGATVVLVHGMGEHRRRYDGFAERLNAQGIALLAADLRGHGEAPGARCFVERFDDYLHDAHALLATARELAGGSPLFLMGHSMGGAIVLRLLGAQADLAHVLAGVLFSSPALKIGRGISPLLLALLPTLASIAPRLRVQKLDPALISRDTAQVAAYASDPLVAHRPPPLRTAAELVTAMRDFTDIARQQSLPLYVMHGDADGLTDADGSRELHAAWGGADKTLRVWPGGYHELLNDLDGEAVARELTAWLTARC